jgi:TrmH family RNA methyltransferase
MKFEDIKKLQQKKYREESGHFLIEGEHLVAELHKAVQRDPRLLESELYVTHEHGTSSSPFPTHVISARQMAQICETREPQGIAAVVPMLPAAAAQADERAICLYEIQDPGNLGTLLRTLAWFGGFRCLLTPHSVDPYNPKVVRAAMGATFHVPVEVDVNMSTLRQRYASIASLGMRGECVPSASFARHDCYLFGNESHGIPHEIMTELHAQPYTIPGRNTIDSLNLAAAVNMCLYELNRPTLG